MTDVSATKPILVVKLGSSSVTRDSGPDTSILADALDQAVAAMAAGWGVVLVSSGAQSVGGAVLADAGRTGFSPKLAAAVGQPILMDFYRNRAEASGARVSQFLVGEADLRSQRQMTAIARVLRESLAQGIIPIVNGNDPADEGKTNNDLVAAGIAVMTQATHLLLLTDVDGVYAGSPGEGSPLEALSVDDTHTIRSRGGGSGTGGIKSKLRAAEITARNGVETWIASARDHGAIGAVVEGREVGTRIHASSDQPLSTARKWIAGGAIAQGSLIINAEAEQSIKDGKSLFASGIKRVKGAFRAGDVVEIVSPREKLLGRGTVRLSSELLTLVRALKVREIAEVVVEVLNVAAGTRKPTVTQSPRLEEALTHLRAQPRDVQRRLLAEVIALFPDDTAGALLVPGRGGAATVDRYAELIQGLAVIHNDQLVEFS